MQFFHTFYKKVKLFLNYVENFLGQSSRNSEEWGHKGEDKIPKEESGKQLCLTETLACAMINDHLGDVTQQEKHDQCQIVKQDVA